MYKPSASFLISHTVRDGERCGDEMPPAPVYPGGSAGTKITYTYTERNLKKIRCESQRLPWWAAVRAARAKHDTEIAQLFTQTRF